jgi:hypothetical protein
MCLRLFALQISLYNLFTVCFHDALYRSRRWLAVWVAHSALQTSAEVQHIIVTYLFTRIRIKISSPKSLSKIMYSCKRKWWIIQHGFYRTLGVSRWAMGVLDQFLAGKFWFFFFTLQNTRLGSRDSAVQMTGALTVPKKIHIFPPKIDAQLRSPAYWDFRGKPR